MLAGANNFPSQQPKHIHTIKMKSPKQLATRMELLWNGINYYINAQITLVNNDQGNWRGKNKSEIILTFKLKKFIKRKS